MRKLNWALIVLLALLISCGPDVYEPPEGVVYFQINKSVDNDTEDHQSYLDLNTDGFNDIGFFYDCEIDERAIEVLSDCDEEFHTPHGRVSMFLSMRFDTPNQVALINRLNEGDVIDENLGIDGGCAHLSYQTEDTGGIELGDFPPGSGEGFIAIQIRNPDGLFHFGWLRVNVQAGCNQVDIIDGAYELRQDKPIDAGQKN